MPFSSAAHRITTHAQAMLIRRKLGIGCQQTGGTPSSFARWASKRGSQCLQSTLLVPLSQLPLLRWRWDLSFTARARRFALTTQLIPLAVLLDQTSLEVASTKRSPASHRAIRHCRTQTCRRLPAHLGNMGGSLSHMRGLTHRTVPAASTSTPCDLRASRQNAAWRFNTARLCGGLRRPLRGSHILLPNFFQRFKIRAAARKHQNTTLT